MQEKLLTADLLTQIQVTRGTEDLLLEESTHVHGKLTQKSQTSTPNTLTPEGHLALISHQDVTTESNIRLMRIIEMIANLKSF